MADFSWLKSVPADEWEQRAEGHCLKAMRWSELIARSGAHEDAKQLATRFMEWAEHDASHFALTWDLPVTPTSYVYVCRTRSPTGSDRH